MAHFFSIQSFSQNGTVKGIVIDSSIKQAIAAATVTIMKKSDSSLITFTMVDNKGRFELNDLPLGEFRILLTHVNYHNSSYYFTIDAKNQLVDLGIIHMIDKTKLLKEVLINAESAPVTLIGDTIQYNANSYKTPPNSNVEELLKKLPGIKVAKDGSIKAQGEKVKTVLVDGKEFFGNDPKIATKNLPADAIDKVQVFDKLSDQAQLTGFDDGNSEKTINLKLKKDKKKGNFGKTNAGAGTNDRYQVKFNINSFKGARQLSTIGIANNSNAEGFSYIDVLNFTGALNQLKNGSGNININIGPNDPLAGLLGNNTGINSILGSGINYNDIIGSKIDLHSNYFFSRFDPVRITNIQRNYFLPGNLYKQNSLSENLSNNHKFNFSAEYLIDSFQSLKVSSSLNYQKITNTTVADYNTLSEHGTMINEGSNNNLSMNEGTTFNTNILFRKKLLKKGRTFSFNLLTSSNGNKGTGDLASITKFYNSMGSLFRSDSTNQQNNNRADLKGFSARVVYTEPISKRSIFEFNLGSSLTRNTAYKSTYDYNHSNGKFDLINNLLTNDFENTYSYTTGGFRLRSQTKNYNYAIGANWQYAGLEGRILTNLKDSSIIKKFTDVLPNARFQYNFNRFKNVTLTYNVTTNQPTLTQLQPIPDNSNPLYVKLGNPNLKQELSHSIRLNASIVDPIKNKNLFAFILLQQTQNKIVNYDYINALGIDSVTPVNVNGIYNFTGEVSYGFPLRFLKGNLDISSIINKYHGMQFINAMSNTINMFNIGPEIRVEMNPTEKLNISVSFAFNYSKTKYSIPSARNAKYFIQEYKTEIGWHLSRGFYFASDFNYQINNQYGTNFSTKLPLWNLSLSKQMLHFNRGELKLSAMDIFNKNVNISRTSNQNYVEDSRSNTLRRFFIVSFTFNLNKAGLMNEGSGGLKVIKR